MLIYVIYFIFIPLTVTSSTLNQSNVDENELCIRDQNGLCISCKHGRGSPERNCECSVNCKNGNCTSGGDCQFGCEDGFYGRRCDNLCVTSEPNSEQCASFSADGILRETYGNCERCKTGMFPDPERAWWCADCPNSCMGGECDPVNGSCTRGCFKGHWSSDCKETCEEGCHSCRQTDGICEIKDCTKIGFVEKNCLTNCSRNCKTINGTSMCMVKDGSCFDQCENSFYGPYCNISCQSSCNGSDRTCDRQTGYCLHGCDDGYFGLNCTQMCKECSNNICDQKTGMCIVVKNISQSGNGQLEGVQETAAGDDRWDVKTTLLLAGVPISCVVFTMGIVTLLVFKCIRKKRKKDYSSLYRRRHSPDVIAIDGTSSNEYAEINEDDMFTYTSIVRRETTKPVDVTPVSIYMTVPLDEGISRDVTFNDGMTTDQSLDEDVVPDDLNRSPIPTITPCVNGEYLTVVHELPMPMKHKI
ncbi:multiple epidermal growth factor-like domains protein 10 [Mya arenaria]|uniref:multiple epidermal growth factor-like domains protein 10 n=1 Tax=Mya arenaria TaxID=6604 RepID=UPI0022E3CA6B|nr:multiple epidermal growth factor-like domains protein 10 [Mya arenaria]